MKIQNKKYDVYFRRNGKEKYWELEGTKSLLGFHYLLETILVSTKEERLEIKLILNKSGWLLESKKSWGSRVRNQLILGSTIIYQTNGSKSCKFIVHSANSKL